MAKPRWVKRKRVGRLESGEEVFDRIDGSHIHPGVRNYLSDILSTINSHDHQLQRIDRRFKFHNAIGHSEVVERKPTDEIVMATRFGRSGPKRYPYAINRSPEPTNWLRVVIARDSKHSNQYFVISCYPSVEESPLNDGFWQRHAYAGRPVDSVQSEEDQ